MREVKARFQMARPSTLSDRAIRPSDVPGKLLNMALLNIGSDDHCLRLAAYNLLVALCLTFNFDVGNQLLSAKGKELITLHIIHSDLLFGRLSKFFLNH